MNSRHLVLETSALPTELLPHIEFARIVLARFHLALSLLSHLLAEFEPLTTRILRRGGTRTHVPRYAYARLGRSKPSSTTLRHVNVLGLGGETRTRDLTLPKRVRYQLCYTQMLKSPFLRRSGDFFVVIRDFADKSMKNRPIYMG